MKKKIIPTILIIILMMLTYNVYAFTDIENHWAKDAIIEFSNANIINGYENNEFRPNTYITRAEVVSIINRMNGITKESSKYIPDIKRDDWYYSDIRKAVGAGIMKGDNNGFTNPNSYITREEAIVMLSRAFLINDSVIATNNFIDKNNISLWAEKELNSFIKFNYIKGYGDNTIRPKENITRAELITIINRMFTKIAITGIYEGNISGSMIVIGKNVVLNNLIINGNLIIAGGTKETLVLNNVEVKGNLILREKIDSTEIVCTGEKVLLYTENIEEVNKYQNEEYGILFSVPNNICLIEKWNQKTIDYTKKNLVIIDIIKNDEFYYKGIVTLAKEELKKADNIYNIEEKGNINNSNYILYKEAYKDSDNYFLIIKRENVVYKISLYNVITKNIVENILGTLKLFKVDEIKDSENVVYKNNKMNLKFSYREGYIGVDDSYNTNNIYSGDAPIKLFIQVNSIIDIQDYSFDEVILLLKTLIEPEGELVQTEKLKVYNENAVKFKIESEEKVTYSLYIVYKNILYNFIFKSDKDIMNEIGEDLFNEIISNIEI